MTIVIAALVTASFGLLGTWLEVSRRQNKNDHAKGYKLLQSIDTRTIGLTETMTAHGERLAVVETKVEALQSSEATQSAEV